MRDTFDPGRAALIRPKKEVFRVAKALLTCVPEPPAEARERAVPRAAMTSPLHILRYNVLSAVHLMTDDPQPKKIPLIFFRTLTGSEPRTGVADGVAGRGKEGDRHGPVASAMAMAGWNAAVPRDGRRPLGDSDGPAYETNSARDALSLP